MLSQYWKAKIIFHFDGSNNIFFDCISQCIVPSQTGARAIRSSFDGSHLINYPIKRYSIIDQHLARYFEYQCAGLPSPLSYLCSQIITSYFYSMISTNQKTGLQFKPIVESVYLYSSSILEFLLYDTTTLNHLVDPREENYIQEYSNPGS